MAKALLHFAMGFLDWNILLVFLLNLSSTCLGTLRTIFLARKILRPVYVTTFIDSIIFVYSVTLVAKGNSFAYIIAFAAGRVCGIYVGSLIEGKLALGSIEVVVYKHLDTGRLLAEQLRYHGFSVNMQVGYNIDGQQNLILTIITNRKNWPLLHRLIRESDRNLNMYVKSLDTAKGTIIKRQRPRSVPKKYSKPAAKSSPSSPIAEMAATYGYAFMGYDDDFAIKDEPGLATDWEDCVYRSRQSSKEQ